MRRTRLIPWVFVSLVLMFAFAVPYVLAIGKPLEDALLKGNWKGVVEILEKDNKKVNDPVARLIMAHASLATNCNNASMLLFLSAKEEEDLNAWHEWTESLLRRHSQNPVALYLSADARARTGRLEEAKEGFTQALRIKNNFALALNGRGVVRVLTNEWNEALMDFHQTTSLTPDYADAHASLGTYWILKEAPEGALEAFNRALTVNPDFALVYNGRGCAHFGRGKFEDAAQDFRLASQLSPILVISEINQGLTSAYASKLIALASMERKPGTTFKTVIQQYSNILKEQEVKSLKMLPSQKDRTFWKKMDALPWILKSDDKTRALVKEYGLQNVQMGAFLKMQKFKSQIAEAHQKTLSLQRKVDSYNRWIVGSAIVDFTSSLAFSSSSAAKTMQQGWKPFLKESGTALGIAGAGATVRSRTAEVLIPGLLSDPFSSTVSSISKGVRYVAEDKRYAAMLQQDPLPRQIATWGAQLRSMEINLPKLGGRSAGTPSIKSSSPIRGYYTSTDRPLTELGALASMVDKGIKPMQGSQRSALIVSQDPFRTNLLQSELGKYGFQTKVIPPSLNPQAEARRLGADVILGIRGTTETKLPQIKRPPMTIETPRVTQPQIKHSWDWGKSFTPVYPKGAPGGISTEELARSFVDKGNWPVMTTFGLFYKASPAPEVENKE